MEHNFQPLLFGGDINVYSVARAFHEAYGVRSVCYGKFASGPAYGSTIIDYRVCPDNEDAATFRKNVAQVAGEFPDKTVLVIGCGDSYVKLAAENKDQFPPNCLAATVSGELINTLIHKEKFYALCDQYGIDHPDAICACVGGGSNAIGVMNAFLDDERVNLYGYEAGGNGPESGKHAIRFAPGTGQLGMFQGAKSYLLETDEGQTLDTYSISAGLDYASVGPEHAWLKDIGRVNYSWATDEEAMNAFRDLSQTEGIIPAIESSHAVAGAYKAAADLKAKGYDKAVMIVNISGRGDKDMATAGKWFGYLTDDQAAALDVAGAHGNTVA